VCDPGQFRVLLIERRFYAVFSSCEFVFSLQLLLLFVSCVGLGWWCVPEGQ
jgi:hypothetical protein